MHKVLAQRAPAGSTELLAMTGAIEHSVWLLLAVLALYVVTRIVVTVVGARGRVARTQIAWDRAVAVSLAAGDVGAVARGLDEQPGSQQ